MMPTHIYSITLMLNHCMYASPYSPPQMPTLFPSPQNKTSLISTSNPNPHYSPDPPSAAYKYD